MELRPILAIAAVLLVSQAAADGAYKWVDENGVVHYSDVPREGAELVNLSEYSRETGNRIAPRVSGLQICPPLLNFTDVWCNAGRSLLERPDRFLQV